MKIREISEGEGGGRVKEGRQKLRRKKNQMCHVEEGGQKVINPERKGIQLNKIALMGEEHT